MCNVGYIRVSTDEQRKKGFSVEGQKVEIQMAAERNGDSISNWYVDDGYSGTNIRRPGLQAMLKECSKRKIERIYIVSSD